ncbi:MAG: type II secretion system protein [Lautropia sp.]
MSTHRAAPPARLAPQRGFTLVEVAIALMIMGLITVGVVSTLNQQAEQRRIVETRATLQKAREALLAFAAANGRLPCPATAASGGAEASTVTGTTVACTAETGLLPAVTLGMSELDSNGLLGNGWKDSAAGAPTLPRAIRYAITRLSGTPVQDALTSPGLGATAANAATRRADVQTAIATNNAGVFICRSAAGAGATPNRCGTAANTLAASMAAAVWSLGANGNDPAAFSADESQNYTMPIARVLVSRDFAPQGATGGMFDDQLTWLPFSLLLERLVTLGHVQ